MDILAYTACLGLIILMGGQPERVGALIITAGSLATAAVAVTTWQHLELGVLVVDIVVLTALWAVALTSNRFWPYWVTAWQLIAVLVHLQMVFFSNIMPAAYSYSSKYLAFPMVLLMLLTSVQIRLRLLERSA